MRWAVALVVVCACNRVLGLDPTIEVDARRDADISPDLDDDGIPDDVDTCIASEGDAIYDSDNDGEFNRIDPCPAAERAPNVVPGDADHDGIFDACDPFPAIDGDRRRCMMAFTNPDLNQRLWVGRTGEPVWQILLEPGHLASAPLKTEAVLAAEPIAGSGPTTFNVYGHYIPEPGRAFRVWLRAADAPSPTDIGCEIAGDLSSAQLTILPGGVSTPVTPLADGRFWLSATIFPNAGANDKNVRCSVYFAVDPTSPTYSVSTRIELSPGRFGFEAVNDIAYVFALDILERDDTPPL